MTILFCLLLAAIFYTYLGYPILLWVLGIYFNRKVRKGPFEPTVSIIISAFNEEKRIRQKIENLLSLDYPSEKMEILVGSDGACDQTDEIVSLFDSGRVRFLRFRTNRGKPQVLNALVREARGEVLVFNDVRQNLAADAVKELVRNFHDPEVGCVSGELHFSEVPGAAIGRGMSRYWDYEKFIRKCESRIGSMIGATGAIYAIRRFLFTEFPSDILVDDMYLPLTIVQRGFRTVFDPAARAFDSASTRGVQEFRRKVRTLAGNYQIFYYLPGLFHPFQSSVAWQIFSHKFLRLMVPFFLIALYVTNAALCHEAFFRTAFLLQNIFYALALAEAFRDRRQASIGEASLASGKSLALSAAFTFCLLNWSALVGFGSFLKGRIKGAWQKAYA